MTNSAASADAADEAAGLGLCFIPGVEISVSWANETIHIVGLRIDPRNLELIDGLAEVRGGRQARALEMAEGLARAGIAGAYEGALKYVGNPNLISRSHFARYLVEAGACSDMKQVFQRYLVRGQARLSFRTAGRGCPRPSAGSRRRGRRRAGASGPLSPRRDRALGAGDGISRSRRAAGSRSSRAVTPRRTSAASASGASSSTSPLRAGRISMIRWKATTISACSHACRTAWCRSGPTGRSSGRWSPRSPPCDRSDPVQSFNLL